MPFYAMQSVIFVWRETYHWMGHRRFESLERILLLGRRVKYNTSHATIFLTFLLRRATTCFPLILFIIFLYYGSWIEKRKL